MKTFKQFLDEDRQGELAAIKPKKDDPSEVGNIKPRSKEEEDFVNQNHPTTHTDHPVAKEDQFTADKVGHEDHFGYDGDPGEKNINMQGSSKVKDSGPDGSKKRDTSPAAGRADGDRNTVMQGSSKIKEEVDMSKPDCYAKSLEAIIRDMQKGKE